MELITKRQARVILACGMSTLGLWVRQGKLKVQKRDDGQWGAIYFDRAEVVALRDARLPKPEPVVLPEPCCNLQQRPLPDPDLPGFTDDAEKNQQAWREGKVADSFGNKVYGNERPDGSIGDPQSAIHGNPELKAIPRESRRDSRYQPIHYDYTGGPAVPVVESYDPRSFAPRPQPKPEPGWGGGTTDLRGTVHDPEWIEKFWRKS